MAYVYHQNHNGGGEKVRGPASPWPTAALVDAERSDGNNQIRLGRSRPSLRHGLSAGASGDGFGLGGSHSYRSRNAY